MCRGDQHLPETETTIRAPSTGSQIYSGINFILINNSVWSTVPPWAQEWSDPSCANTYCYGEAGELRLHGQKLKTTRSRSN